MADWTKLNRSGYISFAAALVGAGLAWLRASSYARTHPSGAWFSGIDTTWSPILWAFAGFCLTFAVSFVLCTIAQMPPDKPD